MEQKFTFKRMLSLLVVFTMLFASFAVLAVPAGAVDHYWAEGDYTIADNGNMTANHAYGYVFDIAGLNAAVSETNTICTDNENWQAKGYGWSVSVVLEQVEGDVYKVVKTYNAPQLGGAPWTDHVEDLADGQIAMVVHSSGSRPNAAGDYSETAVVEYANWENKVAALALAAGTEVTLAGIDLEGLTCENGTVTVQAAPSTEPEPIDGIVVDGDLSDWEDNWTLVNGETGYWQTVPTDENELAGSYNFQITSDEENLYVAAEISGLTCTAFRVWFRTNPEATVYTHFYHIDATGAAGKYNTSTTSNSGAAIADSQAVGVFAAGETTTIVEFSVPLAEIGATSGDVEYYANTQSGSTLFYPPVVDGEDGSRTANLPYSKWYVEPAEEPTPEEPEQHDVLVSHINLYSWGAYNAFVITGEGQNSVTKLGYNCEWWIAIKVDKVDGVYTVTAIEGNNGEAKANTASADGFIVYVFSNDADSFAAAGLVEVGDVLLENTVDLSITSTSSETPIGTMSFGPARETEPEEPVVLPEGAIVLDYAGYIHDSYFMIVAGDNKTVAELTALGHGEAKDMNYCVVAVVGADNVITEMHTTLGRPDGVKSDVVCPEGGYLIVLNANKAGYEALLDAEVGDSIELYNVDVDSIRGVEGNTALENAGFVIVPAEEPEVENLKVEVNVNDRAVLTDGEIDVTDSWFNGASGKAVLINNNACTTKAMDVTVLYALDGTKKIDSLALTFFHEGITMIGYPEGQVLVEVSTDGETYTEVGKFDLAESGLSKETYGTVTNVFEFDAVDAAYVKATFTVGSSTDVLGPEPDQGKVFWEFVALTEVAVTEYVPVTSKVVTDFNPTGYKASIGGANGAFIYNDADIYAASGLDWWIHTAFKPTDAVDGGYEVVEIRAPQTGNYIASIPEGGFIWVAWSDAPLTPESSGAYAYNFMSDLKTGSIVTFAGVDFANETTEADATASVWVDPNAPVNVALNKDYTISGDENATYNAKLTDGAAFGAMSYDNKWFGFTAANTTDSVGYVIIDLGAIYDIDTVQAHLITYTQPGCPAPEFVKVYVSNDGETWGDAIGELPVSTEENVAYWAKLADLEVSGQYVKIEVKITGTFAMLNEIEVYGEAAPVVEEITLVEGDNDITVPALGSSVATTNFDKDYVITIAGNWNVTVLVNGIEYYPNRMGDLEAPLPAGENTVEFKNSAEEAAEIVATVAAPVVGDTMDDPIVLEEDGDYVADVTEKYPEGVYYQYTATEDGTVTITITTETGWTYVINNITAGKYGDTHWSDDETVVATETIEVKAGDVIQFLVATYDADNPWSAPVGTVNFTLDVPGTTVEPVLPPEDAKFSGQILTNGGFAEKDVTIFVRLGELDTIAEVAAALRGLDLTDPAQAEKADYNYYYLVLVGADGIVTEVNYNLGRETGDKSNVVIPEGGYALLAHGVGEAAEALKGIEVGQKIVLTNVDLAALAEATEASELTDAYYSVYDVAPETVEIALGDINMDGEVNQYDYILAKRAHFNNITLTESQAKVGDMDADGDNDQYDYILIKRIHFDNFSTDAKVEVPVADVPVTDAEA